LAVFHVELRKFPHSFWRFNLSEQELHAELLAPWLGGGPLDAGERRWDSRETTLTVIEGPRLEMQELSMGRGWRNATRHGEDVTARVLAQARALAKARGRAAEAGAAGAPAGAAMGASRGAAEEADRLHALLGSEAEALLSLWQAARERHPERSPSECLALAESALRSLEGR
jgi:hypothetical protein